MRLQIQLTANLVLGIRLIEQALEHRLGLGDVQVSALVLIKGVEDVHHILLRDHVWGIERANEPDKVILGHFTNVRSTCLGPHGHHQRRLYLPIVQQLSELDAGVEQQAVHVPPVRLLHLDGLCRRLRRLPAEVRSLAVRLGLRSAKVWRFQEGLRLGLTRL